MHISFNVLGLGSCAQIYAYADAGEPGYQTPAGEIRAIKIWHNSDSVSMNPSFVDTRCHNDKFVEFESRVLFRDFCSQFEASEFNACKNHSTLSHNCANSAYFALKLANIPITLPTRMFAQLMEFSNIRLLTTTLTPLYLFDQAVTYKKKQIKESSFSFKFQLASHALSFWKKHQRIHNPSLDVIEKEVKSRLKLRHHHIERYIHALRSTTDLCFGKPSKQQASEYRNESTFFKERNEPPFLSQRLWFEAVAIYSCLVEILLLLMDSSLLWLNTSILFASTLMQASLLCNMLKNGPHYGKSDTRLSMAMNTFADERLQDVVTMKNDSFAVGAACSGLSGACSSSQSAPAPLSSSSRYPR